MKKLCLILMAALLCFGMVACGGDTNTDSPAGNDAPTTKTLNFNVGFEPDSFDPQASNVLETSIHVAQIYDFLYREDTNGNFVPSLAEGYTVTPDNLTYTFTLRDGITFADGTPITAEDVVFSWTRALDPANAFEYAYQLYYIKGGMEFNMGEATADDLALKAIDEKTVEVTLTAPAPYFVSLTGFTTYGIVSKKFVEAQAAYGDAVETTLASGPFKPVEWSKGQYVKYVKNENYWDKDAVKLDELYIYCVSESSTEIQMYDTDMLDITYMTMSVADQTRLGREGKLKEWGNLQTRYMMVNNENPVLSDARVRSALLLALDRKVLAENVVTNSVACTGFVPNSMAAVDNPSNPFRTESLLPDSGDIAKAQQLLADAGYPNGEGFPTDMELIYTTGEANKALAEAIVEMWRVNLNVNITAANLEGTVRRDRKNTGDFEFSLDGWSTDYLDPFSFMEICMSDNQYNNGKYANAEYDSLLNEVKNSADQAVRQAKMVEAEKILVAEAGVLPLYNGTRMFMEREGVTGVVRSLLGQCDFKWADITK